ncbi:MAG: hypothetical protein AAB573_00705 [Patescibacteria group bacterium]
MANELPVTFGAIRSSLKNSRGLNGRSFDSMYLAGEHVYRGDKVKIPTVVSSDSGIIIDITQEDNGRGRVLASVVIAGKDGVPTSIGQGIVNGTPTIIARGRLGKKGFKPNGK